jgi:hypothetical protein
MDEMLRSLSMAEGAKSVAGHRVYLLQTRERKPDSKGSYYKRLRGQIRLRKASSTASEWCTKACKNLHWKEIVRTL